MRPGASRGGGCGRGSDTHPATDDEAPACAGGARRAEPGGLAATHLAPHLAAAVGAVRSVGAGLLNCTL
jgi:hypothetical protein